MVPSLLCAVSAGWPLVPIPPYILLILIYSFGLAHCVCCCFCSVGLLFCPSFSLMTLAGRRDGRQAGSAPFSPSSAAAASSQFGFPSLFFLSSWFGLVDLTLAQTICEF
ncbi:unnamed protein product [Linum trigynum]|uniref:Secreted peptide n=1 Tax=Linum trigynum TaxID=586398 RepID=A0AAV2GVP1_9ROSI